MGEPNDVCKVCLFDWSFTILFRLCFYVSPVVVNAAFWSVHLDQVILKDAKAVDGAALTVSGVAHVLLSNSTISDNENTNRMVFID